MLIIRPLFLLLLPLTTIFSFGQNLVLKKETIIRTDSKGEKVHTIEKRYNKQGQAIEKIMFDALGEIEHYSKYTLDSNGNVLSDTTNRYLRKDFFSPKTNIKYIWSSKYDKFGNILHQDRYYFNTNTLYTETYEYKYDKNNNVLEKREYTTQTDSISFDSIYNTSEVKRRMSQKQPSWLYLYKYNKKNQKIKFSSYFEGKPRDIITYFYKKELKKKEILYYHPDGKKEKNTIYTFHYDKQNHLIKEKSIAVVKYLDKHSIFLDTYEYYENGYLFQKTVLKENKLYHTEKLEYEFW